MNPKQNYKIIACNEDNECHELNVRDHLQGQLRGVRQRLQQEQPQQGGSIMMDDDYNKPTPMDQQQIPFGFMGMQADEEGPQMFDGFVPQVTHPAQHTHQLHELTLNKLSPVQLQALQEHVQDHMELQDASKQYWKSCPCPCSNGGRCTCGSPLVCGQRCRRCGSSCGCVPGSCARCARLGSMMGGSQSGTRCPCPCATGGRCSCGAPLACGQTCQRCGASCGCPSSCKCAEGSPCSHCTRGSSHRDNESIIVAEGGHILQFGQMNQGVSACPCRRGGRCGCGRPCACGKKCRGCGRRCGCSRPGTCSRCRSMYGMDSM